MKQVSPSSHTQRKRTRQSKIVEIQIGVQTKRYEPVPYNLSKAGK